MDTKALAEASESVSSAVRKVINGSGSDLPFLIAQASRLTVELQLLLDGVAHPKPVA